MVIAIDGPAGAGKSTVARAVAQRLGFTYLDTGAMYRSVGLRHAQAGGNAGHVAATISIEFEGERVLVDGEDVTEAIRTPEASEAASHVAGDPQVREALVAEQRRIVATGDWVAEGRDIGTVVAPDAAVKVFLTADPEERARRRAQQQGLDPWQVLKEQEERDARDNTAGRSIHEAPNDATPVDTTGLTFDEVVEQVVTLAIEAKEIQA
jgi:cytidylate kinase